MADLDNNLVSIIMPCYNAGKYIGNTLNSIVAQTYQNWETFVVDDHSTDGSDKIIKEFVAKDSRIKYIKTDVQSGGPTLPRNMGLAAARGRFVAFLDADDMWLPDKLQCQIELFKQADSATAIVFSNYEKINEDGVRNHRIIAAPPAIHYQDYLKGNVIGMLTAMCDMQKVGKIRFENVGHEDYVAWLSILKKGFMARNTGTVEALYRVHGHSVSSNKFKAAAWQWNILINIEKVGYMQGLYYFTHYALRAFAKALI